MSNKDTVAIRGLLAGCTKSALIHMANIDLRLPSHRSHKTLHRDPC
jgi:hypothetical protein